MQSIRDFSSLLPYQLSDDQQKAIQTLMNELRRPIRMRALLIGDVGSGKTVVALACAYAAIASGVQVALLAPTEILVRQHMRTIQKLLGNSKVRIAMLIGNQRDRNKLMFDLANGSLDLVVGTHALLQDDVRFAHLGLVIIDEQHRFGVAQRSSLMDKGDLSIR